MPAGLSKQKITGQNGHPSIKTAVDGVDPTAGGSLVHNIIVNKRSGMDHLRDLRQSAMPGGQLTVFGQSP